MKLIPFRKGNEWGYSDNDGNIIIDTKYRSASLFVNSGFVNKLSDDYYAPYETLLLLDKNGKELLRLNEHLYEDFHESYAQVYTKDELYDNNNCYWGTKFSCRLIHYSGTFIGQNSHDFIGNYSKGHYRIGKMRNKLFAGDPQEYIYGYKDFFGKTVIPEKFLEAPDFEVRWGGVPVLDEYTGLHFIDANGKNMFDKVYNYAKPFRSNGIAIASEANNLFGYIGVSSKYRINPVFSCAFAFSEEVAKVGINEFNFKIQQDVELGLPFNLFESNRPSYEYTFIDCRGKLLFKATFDDAGAFSEGLCWVRKNNEFGFIDKQGNQITGYKYDSVFSFKEGIARVSEENKEYFINKEGERVFEKEYEISILNLQLDNLLFESIMYENFLEFDLPNSKTGFLSGIARVKDNGKFGYINLNGEEFWQD